MCHVHTVEHYATFQRKQLFLMYATTWRNLKDVILSKINQSLESKQCFIVLIWSVWGSQNHRQYKGLGGRERGDSCLMGIVSILQDKTLLNICYTTMWMCFTLLNCTRTRGEDGKFNVLCFSFAEGAAHVKMKTPGQQGTWWVWLYFIWCSSLEISCFVHPFDDNDENSQRVQKLIHLIT